MKDQLGHYYHPAPNDKKTRVYVRRNADDIEFRLWRLDNEQVWDQHGWVPYEAIKQAAEMYKGMGRDVDPMLFYDISVAKVLLNEN
ncbi:hypothetical protein [Halodesulfovibrio aestuarii]|uniref:Uncharacterized protein n=1 Tax=Halodesulfovibrio aestuarii TaxID=126333 RepID=A0A8G2F8C4_9BACT|nr:hypothetical protein [Halodesulfovibrio aestuarii]SHJ35005.1 hypothetical protein SAMN05660830_02200 [Halodesulfovibrio aestuarii]